MDKFNDKERICIDLAIDHKCQGDLQDILYNLKVTWTTQITLTNLWLNRTKNKGDIRNWKFNDVMSVRPEVT